jgi:hypothetical protein
MITDIQPNQLREMDLRLIQISARSSIFKVNHRVGEMIEAPKTPKNFHSPTAQVNSSPAASTVTSTSFFTRTSINSHSSDQSWLQQTSLSNTVSSSNDSNRSTPTSLVTPTHASDPFFFQQTSLSNISSSSNDSNPSTPTSLVTPTHANSALMIQKSHLLDASNNNVTLTPTTGNHFPVRHLGSDQFLPHAGTPAITLFQAEPQQLVGRDNGRSPNAKSASNTTNGPVILAKVLWTSINSDLAFAAMKWNWLSSMVTIPTGDEAAYGPPALLSTWQGKGFANDTASIASTKDDFRFQFDEAQMVRILRKIEKNKNAIFRPNQFEIVVKLLTSTQNVFFIPRCGWGKTLAYEFILLAENAIVPGPPNPVVAIFLPQKILIQQAVERAKKINIPYTLLAPGENEDDPNDAATMTSTSNIKRLLICSMDSINSNVIRMLQQLAKSKRLQRIVVEEAHIPFISQNYRNILWKLALLAQCETPLLFISATLTSEMIDVLRSLTHSTGIIIRAPAATFTRANVKLCLEQQTDEKAAMQWLLNELCDFVENQRVASGFERPLRTKEIRNRGGQLMNSRILIIVNSVNRVTALKELIDEFSRKETRYGSPKVLNTAAQFLQPPKLYHAKMDDVDKKKAIEEWKSGVGIILIGTKAIGVGLDLPDVA